MCVNNGQFILSSYEALSSFEDHLLLSSIFLTMTTTLGMFSRVKDRHFLPHYYQKTPRRKNVNIDMHLDGHLSRTEDMINFGPSVFYQFSGQQKRKKLEQKCSNFASPVRRPQKRETIPS